MRSLRLRKKSIPKRKLKMKKEEDEEFLIRKQHKKQPQSPEFLKIYTLCQKSF